MCRSIPSHATVTLAAIAFCVFFHSQNSSVGATSLVRRVDEADIDDSFANGFLEATGCASYTILLDSETANEDQGVAFVGQDTFVFFEYNLPYNITSYDDNIDDGNDDNDYDDDDNGRYLEETGESYINFGSNAIAAKDWMVAFSDGALDSGCVAMEDETEVFRDVIPGMADGRLSFSNLYYGPICNSSNSTKTSLEMGVFLDSNCTMYVPGLSQVLNQRVLSGWTTARADQHRFYGNGIQNLYSYNALIHQLNGDFSSTEMAYCEDDPQICQQVTEASVDLNTCESLALEVVEASNGNYEIGSNENEDWDEDFAYEYGELVLLETFSNATGTIQGNEVEYEDRFQMYQHTLENYDYCIGTPSDDDGCTGWNYGWGSYDCIASDDNNRQVDCQQGLCYGILESFENGYTLSEWLVSNADILQYEMSNVYKVEKPLVKFWYGLLAMYIIMVALLVAFAQWTKRMLQFFSQTSGSRKIRDKRKPFLHKENSNNSFYTVGSSRGSPSNSPRRFRNALLQRTPTKSNLSFPSSHEMRSGERMEVIGYSRGNDNALVGIPPLDIGAI